MTQATQQIIDNAAAQAAALIQDKMLAAASIAQQAGTPLSTQQLADVGKAQLESVVNETGAQAVHAVNEAQPSAPAPTGQSSQTEQPVAVSAAEVPKLNVCQVNGETRYLTDVQVAQLAAPATVMLMQEAAAPASSRRRQPQQEDYGDEFGLDTVIGATVVVAGAAAVGYLAYKAYQYITE